MAGTERYIAVGDIHGCPHQLEEILELGLAFPDHQWVFLGDYIDRGPDSESVVQILRRFHGIFLLGNHEDRLFDRLRSASPIERQQWLDFTGLSETSLGWLTQIPVPCWDTDSYLFVHDADDKDLTSKWVVHGHHSLREPLIVGNRVNINTSCGAGGPLTAVVLPEFLFLQSSHSPHDRTESALEIDLAALVDETLEELEGEG